MNNQQSEIMTLTEVAEYLHCHKITVYRMVQSGQIPAFQVGSSWRLRREDIDRWDRGPTRGAGRGRGQAAAGAPQEVIGKAEPRP